MSILKADGLKKYYGAGENLVKALDGIDFSVESGEFVAVVGTSGSGKSTLLHMLGGLDTPTSGSVEVDGKELSKMNDDQLTIFRRRNIGFVFQSYNLVPILNVYESIVLPIGLDGEKPDQAYIGQIVRILGLAEKRNDLPNSLSGGQQQRVAIARALATKPAIVLADEPTEYRKVVERPVLMTYAFNVEDGKEADMERFVKDYTERQEPAMDYESRQGVVDEFNGIRSTVLMVGAFSAS